jgi:hypothetical protein
MVEEIISASELPSGGAYTTVGTYDHGEILRLVTALSRETKMPVPDLVQTFGHHLFGQFVRGFPRFFEGIASAFDFLHRVEGFIHIEVRKLYPDAELPQFTCERPSPGCLVMAYRSTRPFADLAHGLIRGCIDHFGEAIDVVREDVPGSGGTRARFVLTARALA